jgi:hypothetical protein
MQITPRQILLAAWAWRWCGRSSLPINRSRFLLQGLLRLGIALVKAGLALAGNKRHAGEEQDSTHQ